MESPSLAPLHHSVLPRNNSFVLLPLPLCVYLFCFFVPSPLTGWLKFQANALFQSSLEMEQWVNGKKIRDTCTAFVIFNQQANAQICLEELPTVLSDELNIKASRAPEPSDVIFSGYIKKTKKGSRKRSLLLGVVCSLSLHSVSYIYTLSSYSIWAFQW